MRIRAVAAAATAAVALVAIASPARPLQGGSNVEVAMGDNFFEPQEIRIDVGDTVAWDGGGIRPHTATSDDGLFDSGQMGASDRFTFTFNDEGKFYYHCTLHGSAQRGMWGVVVVGAPKVDKRPRLIVPDDYPTIQSAVDHAAPKTVIVVRPGRYEESVSVPVPRITIKGKDRFRSVLDGNDSLPTGINVTANRVKIRNLTVRSFTEDGILFDHVDRYTVVKVDSILNRRYGIRANGSFDGVIQKSFGYGSGSSAITIEACYGCGALIEDVRSSMNFAGLLTVNASGFTVRDSTFAGNGNGIVLTSLPDLPAGDGRAALIRENLFKANNTSTIPPSGLSETFGLPYGTGVWIAGVANSLLTANEFRDHTLFGVLVGKSLTAQTMPTNNRVIANDISGSGMFDMAWDGSGSNNCFDGNDTGPTGPPALQDLYGCASRPFTGSPFDAVGNVVDAAIAAGPNRPTEEPPEPVRPSCQKGAPGCGR